MGLRSLRNLILHLKARTDDSHAVPSLTDNISFYENLQSKPALVRLCVDYRIEPHIPPFEQIPANSVKFQPCDFTAQVEYLSR
jgi:hypothetical protein